MPEALWELAFVGDRTREPAPTVGLLLLLKTFQRLGYFVRLDTIPASIALRRAALVKTVCARFP